MTGTGMVLLLVRLLVARLEDNDISSNFSWMFCCFGDIFECKSGGMKGGLRVLNS